MFNDIQINIAGGLDVPLPKMVKVRQHFERHEIEDVAAAVATELDKPEIAAQIKPGASIAIGVGSRGIANLETAVTALVAGLKKQGANPFIFPAMGSHGGATAVGQTSVLANYGITEEKVGAPIQCHDEHGWLPPKCPMAHRFTWIATPMKPMGLSSSIVLNHIPPSVAKSRAVLSK